MMLIMLINFVSW